VKINLLDPSKYLDGAPHDQFDWLRQNDPVHWHDEPGGSGFWALTSYADVKAVERNWRVYSSEPTTMIPDSATMGDETHKNLIFTDPPWHTEHRAFIGEELNPVKVKEMEDELNKVAHDIIDEISEKGSADLVKDLAGKLASYVTADLLSLPRPDVVEMYETSDAISNASSLTEGPGFEAMMKLFGMAQGTYADRQANPGDDLLTRISNGSLQGCPIDAMQFSLDFLLLVNAGGDTTRNALAGGMIALFEHPEQYEALKADHDLVPSAVEEILRWTTPIVYQRRLATEDAEIQGRAIKAGDKVVSFYSSANRDESVFKDPHTFDIRRTPNAHIAFGFGSHFCLGSHLARLELKVMLQAMLERLPDLRAAGAASWVKPQTDIVPTIVGPQSMPVEFTPTPAMSFA
jgi:cytochrome P450